MKQFVLRLILFLVILLVVFGVYRLLTVDALEPRAFFEDASDKPLVIVDTGHGSFGVPYSLAAMEAARDSGAGGLYLPVYLTRDGELAVLPSSQDAQGSDFRSGASTLTLDDVRTLGAEQGLEVASLNEVLRAFPEMRFFVDMPEPSFGALSALLIASDASSALDRLVVRVDNQQLADALRHQVPSLTTTYTSGEYDAFSPVFALGLTPFYRPAAPAIVAPLPEVSPRLIRVGDNGGFYIVAGAVGQARETIEDWLESDLDAIIVSETSQIN
ncbi:MAG: hypothetical protein U9R25_01145 [Chloroflexota bacterium]|nr:hypothetical protein [Chloroflexota bacterium]